MELTLDEVVPCSTIVYRAILKRSFINQSNDGRAVLPGAFLRPVLPAAFQLREKNGSAVEEALSVHVAEPDSSAQSYSEKCGLKNVGTASLHAGRVHDLPLQIVFDLQDEETKLRHCSIRGIPVWQTRDSEAFRLAEDLADRLSEQARLQWEKPRG